jgi:hypothetical protein
MNSRHIGTEFDPNRARIGQFRSEFIGFRRANMLDTDSDLWLRSVSWVDTNIKAIGTDPHVLPGPKQPTRENACQVVGD